MKRLSEAKVSSHVLTRRMRRVRAENPRARGVPLNPWIPPTGPLRRVAIRSLIRIGGSGLNKIPQPENKQRMLIVHPGRIKASAEAPLHAVESREVPPRILPVPVRKRGRDRRRSPAILRPERDGVPIQAGQIKIAIIPNQASAVRPGACPNPRLHRGAVHRVRDEVVRAAVQSRVAGAKVAAAAVAVQVPVAPPVPGASHGDRRGFQVSYGVEKNES